MEVLVVVSIIAILASILIANFGQARVNAKNKAIRTSLSEVQLALEVYKAQNSRYPSATGGYPSALSVLVPSFIQRLPDAAESANSSCSFVYTSDAGGSYYKLTAQNCYGGATNQATGIGANDEFARCPSTCGGTGVCSPSALNFYESMAVYSIGAECL